MMHSAPEDEIEKFVWKLLFKAVNNGLDTVDLAIAMLDKDDEAAGEAIRSKYGLPTKEIVKEAEKVAEEIRRRGTIAEEFEGKSYEFEDPEDERLLVEFMLNAEEIKYFFEWAMNRYDDRLAWPVIIEENCSAIDVRDKSSYGHPVIAIPASREVNGFKLAELIGHEIECHWRNSVNAELIGALKLDDELAYEGLAKVKDNLFDKYYLKKDATPTPYYIIAESLALDYKSFAETSERIFHLLPRKEPNLVTKAWNNTYRAYRGISNTLNLDGYAFTKDRAYFEGYLYAKALDRHGYFEYLSFGLDRLTIKDLIEMTSPYDLEQSAILMDKHIQHQAIGKILKYIKNSQDDDLPVPTA
ncbi:DUF1704 domain-containing protein [Candidatus Saccharibacteria bacterium]|nr:DUF1704 domain-containing protein [Candidatus Saccharibacteria bacterium]